MVLPDRNIKQPASLKWISERSELLQGPLNLALRIGRPLGVSPVTFDSKGMKISKHLCYYSFILIIMLKITELVAYILVYEDDDFGISQKSKNNLELLIWMPAMISSLITTYSVFTSPCRLNRMICYIGNLEKIKIGLGFQGPTGSEWKRRKRFIKLAVILLSLISSHTYIDNNFNIQLTRKSLLTLMSHHVNYVILVMIKMQFIFVVIAVNDVLKAFNTKIKEILETVHSKNDVILFSTCLSLSRLAGTYNQICLLLKQVRDAHGPLLCLMVVMISFDLMLSPFYFALAVVYEVVQLRTGVLSLIWSVYPLLELVAIIEPCHRTKKEIERLRYLINELSITVSHRDPLYKELECFNKQLLLNNNSFFVLNTIILDRPFIFSILKAVITYLLIIIQFDNQIRH